MGTSIASAILAAVCSLGTTPTRLSGGIGGVAHPVSISIRAIAIILIISFAEHVFFACRRGWFGALEGQFHFRGRDGASRACPGDGIRAAHCQPIARNGFSPVWKRMRWASIRCRQARGRCSPASAGSGWPSIPRRTTWISPSSCPTTCRPGACRNQANSPWNGSPPVFG